MSKKNHNIFFSRFEGMRGEKNQIFRTNAISNAGKIKKGQPRYFSFGKFFSDFHHLVVERCLKRRWGDV